MENFDEQLVRSARMESAFEKQFSEFYARYVKQNNYTDKERMLTAASVNSIEKDFNQFQVTLDALKRTVLEKAAEKYSQTQENQDKGKEN